MNTETREKGGSISCATSCEPCGNAETLFPTDDERRIDALRAEIDRLKQPRTLVDLELPLATRNDANGKHGAHWGAKAKKRKKERTGAHLRLLTVSVPKLLRVTLTRLGGREMDFGGLVHALKSVQDGVAKRLKIDDATSGIAEWRFEQKPGGDRPEAVHVKVERLAP